MRKGKKKSTKSKPKEKYWLYPFVTDVHLFDAAEGTFSDFGTRQRVYVHLVPAPWKRVIILSLVYAMAVSFARIIWFEVFGVPQWHLVASEELETEQPSAPVTPTPIPQKPALFKSSPTKVNVASVS